MILINKINNISIITLDSPKGNMLSYSDLSDLDYLLDSGGVLDGDGILLTGNNISFCTGVYLGEDKSFYGSIFKLLDSIICKLFSYNKPLLVAANGHSIGAGFLFLLCADFVYASKSFKIKYGLPEINLGLGLDELMLYVVKRSLPNFLYRDFIYSGKLVSNKILYDYKVIDKLINSELLISQSVNIIKDITENRLRSFVFMKKMDRKDDIIHLNSLLKRECYMELLNLI